MANEHNNVIAALKAAKTTFPELRVGQVIDNARWWWKSTQGYENELFYMSDEDLSRAIFGYIADHTRRNT